MNILITEDIIGKDGVLLLFMPRERGSATILMKQNFINKKELQQHLHNHTEELVLNTMEEMLTKPKYEQICTCDRCQLDIATYALNHLPAKYTATHRGDVITRIEEFEQQFNVDLIAIVTKAIKIVSENPHQDK